MQKSFVVMLVSALIFILSWLWFYLSILFIGVNNYNSLLLYIALFLAILSVYLRFGETH
jgi:uncharacterized membrane protein (DUF106 family)